MSLHEVIGEGPCFEPLPDLIGVQDPLAAHLVPAGRMGFTDVHGERLDPEALKHAIRICHRLRCRGTHEIHLISWATMLHPKLVPDSQPEETQDFASAVKLNLDVVTTPQCLDGAHAMVGNGGNLTSLIFLLEEASVPSVRRRNGPRR
jgi:hypothetical protein